MQGVQGQQPKPFTEADVVTNERVEEVFSCAFQVTELKQVEHTLFVLVESFTELRKGPLAEAIASAFEDLYR